MYAPPNKSIFCAPCRVVKPRVNSLRPKGLGLGANLTEVQALAPTSPYRLPRPDEEQEKDKEDQPQGLVPGGAVVVLSGPHRGLYGKVRNLDMPGAKNRQQGKINVRVRRRQNWVWSIKAGSPCLLGLPGPLSHSVTKDYLPGLSEPQFSAKRERTPYATGPGGLDI